MDTYNPTVAVQSAHANCAIYNSSFCAFRTCGGDCANFVSQCFAAGGMHTDTTWYANWQACDCVGPGDPSTGYRGSLAWINNYELKQWVVNTGRGYPAPGGQGGWQYVGNGDIINYAWSWSSASVPDHICIVTGNNGAGPLVSCHDTDRCDAWWNLDSVKYWNFTNVFAG